MFAQPFDHSFNDLFNQYVNMDSSSTDGNNKDVSFASDLDQFFSLDSLSSDCGDLSSIVSTSKRQRQSPQPWRKGLWCLQQQDAASSAEQGNFSLHETIHPSAISDFNLNVEASSRPGETLGLPSTSPSTPPATPSRRLSKSALVTPKTIRHREPNDRRTILRKQSFSPSLMRSSQLQKSRMAYPEAWAQRFQNFNLHSSDEHLPLSPPPSDILVQHENIASDSAAQMNLSTSVRSADSLQREPTEMTTQYDSALFNQSPAISMPSPSAGALARQQQRYLGHANSSLATSSPPPADEIFTSPHSSDPSSMSSWHSDALGASGLPFTPDLSGHDAQAWWSPMPSRVAQRPTPYQSMVASPTPQRPIQNVNHQNDLLQGGLMIQFDPSFDMSSAAGSSFPSSTMHSTPTNAESHPYSHVPAVHQKFAEHSPFAAPQAPQASRSPSLSPQSSSTKNGSITRNGVNMKNNHRRTHSRKLSSQSNGGPKPIKASGSPKGANKAVTVSFVNFTAQDSKKILTGVAPSGSSKTKARREQEARERRRKLSEAALNAVRNAGGDVEALEAVLC